MLLMGKMVGISKEKVRQSFVELNNHLIRSNGHRTRPDKLLILLPHCIQNFDCEIKITGNIRNCKGCGKCEIKDLIELSDRHHLKIAVACELDLTAGIQDTYPIPVIGILNERPNRPCINTKVDINRVRNAIVEFLESPNPSSPSER